MNNSQETLLKECDNIYEKLDEMQENPIFQIDEGLMFNIGEAMGYIENCRDLLTENKELY